MASAAARRRASRLGTGCAVLAALLVSAAGIAFLFSDEVRALAARLGQRATTAAVERQLARVAPELEVVSVDVLERTAVLRDRREGRRLEVDLGQLEQGRLELQDGKRRWTLDLEPGETAPQPALVEGEDAEMPGWLPAYPGVVMAATFAQEEDGRLIRSWTFSTSDSLETVLRSYRETLAGQAFHVSLTTSGLGPEQGVLVASDADDRRSVSLLVQRREDATRCVLTGREPA